MLKVENLKKCFGAFEAVKGISFAVNKGEVLGFLGPNGAGKSTTMRMITGFLPPTSGTAVICGHDITKDPVGAKSCIGYLPEAAPSYRAMKVREFLEFIATVRGFSGKTLKEKVDAVIEKARLTGVASQTMTFSPTLGFFFFASIHLSSCGDAGFFSGSVVRIRHEGRQLGQGVGLSSEIYLGAGQELFVLLGDVVLLLEHGDYLRREGL